MSKSKVTQSVTESVTRSPIELFWTAKNMVTNATTPKKPCLSFVPQSLCGPLREHLLLSAATHLHKVNNVSNIIVRVFIALHRNTNANTIRVFKIYQFGKNLK